MPVTVECQQCGTAFVVPPSRVKRRKFCSHACRHRWMAENLRGEAHPMHGRRHSAESIRKMSESQKANGRIGPKASTWKGGRFKSRGYWMVALSGMTLEDRMLAEPMTTRGRDYVPEHRLVVARTLGRSLASGEVVHHINGVKTDNRPENLELHGARTHKMEHAAVYRELRRLRAENETLREALSKCSCGTFPQTG